MKKNSPFILTWFLQDTRVSNFSTKLHDEHNELGFHIVKRCCINYDDFVMFIDKIVVTGL